MKQVITNLKKRGYKVNREVRLDLGVDRGLIKVWSKRLKCEIFKKLMEKLVKHRKTIKLENIVNRLELNPQSTFNTSWPQNRREYEAQSVNI